jgi:hypothetical protein
LLPLLLLLLLLRPHPAHPARQSRFLHCYCSLIITSRVRASLASQAPGGRLCLILPTPQGEADSFIATARACGLKLVRLMSVHLCIVVNDPWSLCIVLDDPWSLCTFKHAQTKVPKVKVSFETVHLCVWARARYCCLLLCSVGQMKTMNSRASLQFRVHKTPLSGLQNVW